MYTTNIRHVVTTSCVYSHRAFLIYTVINDDAYMTSPFLSFFFFPFFFFCESELGLN